MRDAVRILVAAVIALSVCGIALSYTRPRRLVDSEVVHPRWPVGEVIPVIVNTEEPNRIVKGSRPFQAVRNMFELRSTYSTLRFSVTQGNSPDDIGIDGTNLVTFKGTANNQSAVMGYGAVTWFMWDVVDDEAVLLEADIVFNATIDFTTTGIGDEDIENLGGHELIHFMGFEHSGVMGSTAFPNRYTEVPNERNLALDDRAAGNFAYPFPEIPSRTGSLSGVVEKPGGVSVFGAHVVALRESDGSPVSDISIFGGEWRIDGLPPDRYTVYVEPLDGPAETDVVGGIYLSQPIDNAFPTTFAGGNATPTIFEVAAGVETSAGPIEVGAAAGSLNLRRLGLASDPGPVIAESATNVDQGEVVYLTLHGPGVHLVPDDGVAISGSGIDVSSVFVVRGFTQGAPYMIVPLTVGKTAQPGVRTIFADNGTDIAAMTGGIEVHPATPNPNLLRNDELTSVAPIAPALAGLLPLEPTGPDDFPGTGEGVLRELNGSDDDDDLYAPQIESGFVDPDLELPTDGTRPLVLYQLDDRNRTLFLGKSDSGRIVVTYTGVP